MSMESSRSNSVGVFVLVGRQHLLWFVTNNLSFALCNTVSCVYAISVNVYSDLGMLLRIYSSLCMSGPVTETVGWRFHH